MRNLCILIVALYGASFAAAADASRTQFVTHACASIASPDARLSCFDAAFPRPGAALSGAEGAGSDKSTQDFGLSQVQLMGRNPERANQIVAKISGINTGSSGKRVISLDNGQVWMLLERGSGIFLKQGEQVTVRTAALSSFFLLSSTRVASRARRIK